MKKKPDLNILIIVMAAILVMGSSTLAVDVFTPPWRGQPGSTVQQWNFPTNDTTPSPDFVNNPYGAPLLKVNTPFSWIDDSQGNIQGVWPLSGEMDFYIPNRPEFGPEKEIWIQLAWMPGNLDPTPFLPDQPIVGVTPFDSMQMTREDNLAINGWTHSLFKITIWPNPNKEWITIKGDILVDQVVIDTICIPEPTTLLLLVTGGLIAKRYRKRTQV